MPRSAPGLKELAGRVEALEGRCERLEAVRLPRQDDAARPSITIDELADKVKALGLRTRADSVQIIRRLRDGGRRGPKTKRA